MRFTHRFCGLKDPIIHERFPGCLNVPEKYVQKPDPCIYSQGELAANPEAVRWENVDIGLFDGAIPVRSTFGLEENKQYTVEVRFRNCSADVAAFNTKVELFSAAFGIGGWAGGISPLPLPQTFVNIPPGSGLSLLTSFVTTSRSIAFLARLTHPDDANGGNNEGWHITRLDKSAPTSGASPIFPLFNPFNGVRFIKVYIFEEGPEQWFPDHIITIGRNDQFLPVGVLPDQPHVISGHLASLDMDIPDTTPVGTLHISHLTAYALPDITGPETLVGGVTYIIETT